MPSDQNHRKTSWVTETQIPPPKNILEVDERISVDKFLSLASEGSAVRWIGDYHAAKSFLTAINRRMTKNAKPLKAKDGTPAGEIFHLHRQAQSHRARIQSRLLIRVEPDLTIDLPRAPDVREAIVEALDLSVHGIDLVQGFDLSLRELLGMIGAHEWRKQGVWIEALQAKIHPHYGVFSPLRGEYLDLIAQAPLPERCETAFDIGTGSGVIAALLARRGFKKVIAVDNDRRALACARENLARLGCADGVELRETEFFPGGQADLIVCNPPWVPARPTSRVERAVYDPDSQMLRGFLFGLAKHLEPHGEGWLIISNLAELLGLRAPGELTSLIQDSGLQVIERLDTHPRHAKALDSSDPLHIARSHEVTSLWRLKAR